MDVLVLNLSGPLQSWGDSSHFKQRKTLTFPTLSGVTGLLASAMGITREETDKMRETGLLNIDIIVRVDKKGVILTDNQNIFYKPSENKRAEKDYLQDATFTVGIICTEKESNLLHILDESLQSPVFTPFLGRKSCPPTGDISLGVKEYKDATDFLKFESLRKGSISDNEKSLTEVKRLAYVSSPNGFLIQDRPINYSRAYRRYTYRSVEEKTVVLKNPMHYSSFDPLELAD